MRFPLTRLENIEMTIITMPLTIISFLSVIDSTSGRLHSEFVILLFLQAHWSGNWPIFASSGVQFEKSTSGLFHFHCATFSSKIKSKVRRTLTKVVVYVLTLTLESITSRTHTHPSHSETSLFSLSSHRHLYIGLLFTSSLYRFIINKQQKKEANPKNAKNGTSCPSSGECGGNKTREGVSREGVRRGGGQRRERMKRGRDMMWPCR